MIATPEAYKLAFEMRADYLYADLTCDTISHEVMKLYLKEITDKCHERGVSRVLVDRDCSTPISLTHTYLATSSLCDHAPSGLCMAIVDGDADNRRKIKFGLLSVIDTDVNAEVFSSVDEAEAWLAIQPLAEAID